ncbi:hypothetical protein M404DRAFT_1009171, partial [Pisolithus tinctorius Marx 270]
MTLRALWLATYVSGVKVRLGSTEDRSTGALTFIPWLLSGESDQPAHTERKLSVDSPCL